jgi:hypothetical protein
VYSAIPEKQCNKQSVTKNETTHSAKEKKKSVSHLYKRTQATTLNKQITSRKNIEQVLNDNNLFPPEVPVKSAIGKSGLMWPQGIALLHDAATLLDSYSRFGCPTDCGPQWSKQHILAAIQRGAHPTAKKKEARRYLIIQTMNKVRKTLQKLYVGEISGTTSPQL